MSSKSESTSQQEGVVKQIIKAVGEKDITGSAKEVAYNILFSIAPLLIFLTSAAGAVTQIVNDDLQNPAEPVLQWMKDTLPADAASFLEQPIENALQADLGFLMSFGAILALWGAKGAMSGVIKGLNKAYDIEEDSRSFVKQTLVSIGLTIALALMIGVAGLVFFLGTDVGVTVADSIGLGDAFNTVSNWLRWPLIAIVAIIAVAMIHKFGPNIEAPLKWYLPGAAFTIIGIAIASFLLTIYFRFSGGYNEAYGAFGAVLVFIFWLYVMSMIVLMGGVVNMAIQKEIPPARSDVEEDEDQSNDNRELLQEERFSGPGGYRGSGEGGESQRGEAIGPHGEAPESRVGKHPWNR